MPSTTVHTNKTRNAHEWRLLSNPILHQIFHILMDPSNILSVSIVVFLVDMVLSLIVIQYVKYTEIDWSTYMQQVKMFMNGTRVYTDIHGDTGPLVYPAGHVYFYSLFHFMTRKGQDIRVGQYIFYVIYMINSLVVIKIYSKVKTVPPLIVCLMFLTSYRVHSIFLLRLFNDGLAITILHVSILLFLNDKWYLGCTAFSLAVSVKMNILLFAPGLLLLLMERCHLTKTITCLSICAAIQLLLGLPFLLHSPLSYLKGSFDISRVFLYEWTVNWKFLPEWLFLSRSFHIGLLASHLAMLVVLFYERWIRAGRKLLAECALGTPATSKNQSDNQRIVTTLFVSNFCGIVFSRSLHYQFYVWYFYSIPHILWTTKYPFFVKLSIMSGLELVWMTFPSTPTTSMVLIVLHIVVICGLTPLRHRFKND